MNPPGDAVKTIDWNEQPALPELAHFSVEIEEEEHCEVFGDRYLLIRRRRRGGAKDVFEAHDLRTRRDIALAMMRPDAVTPELRHDFEREARITARLEHPNIVPVHDVDLDREDLYFTMKLLTGATLEERLREAAAAEDPNAHFPLQERLDVFSKVCDAVAYARSQGVLHLDIKPDNIQICDFGQVFVLDWGLARDLHGLIGERRGPVTGTPGYMAPEQIRGERHDLMTRADTYALGAVLYSMLTFRRPFGEGYPDAIMNATLNGKLDSPMLCRPDLDIPRALDAVAMKAMSVKPRHRYASVEDLREEIRKHLAGYATLAQSADVLTQCRLFIARHRVIVGLVAGSAVVIAALGTFSFSFVTESRRRTALAERQAAQAVSRIPETIDWVKEYAEHQSDLGDPACKDTLQRVKMRSLPRFMFAEAIQDLDRLQDDTLTTKLLLFKAVLLFGDLQTARAHELCQRVVDHDNTRPLDIQVASDLSDLCRRLKANPDIRPEVAAALVRRCQDYRWPWPIEVDALVAQLSESFYTKLNWSPEKKMSYLRTALTLLNDWVIAEQVVVSHHGDRFDLDLTEASELSDLGPVFGLPLRHVNLEGTRVENLRPILASKPSTLNVAYTRLSSLAGIPSGLDQLDIRGLRAPLPDHAAKQYKRVIADKNYFPPAALAREKRYAVVVAR